MKKLHTVVISALLMASAGYAQAGLKEDFVLKRIISKLDTNVNGVVDLSEMQSRWDRSFFKYDTNNDKNMTFAEFKVLVQDSQQKMSRFRSQAPKVSPDTRFKRLDTNKNNLVSYTEYFDQKMAGFKQIDLNKNNALSLDELRAMKDRLQALR